MLYLLSLYRKQLKKAATRTKRGKYYEPLKVNGSFLNIMKASVKYTTKTATKKAQ